MYLSGQILEQQEIPTDSMISSPILAGNGGDVNGATNISAENVDHNDPAGMLNYAKNNGYPNIWEQTHQCER